jgi:signal recognition particle receptor subunit beta
VSADREAKILFAGPVGAGKTTAIRSISDRPPVETEVASSDPTVLGKQTTTVAMDYGQLLLPDGTAVSLYGTPGQRRFSFMWEILSEGALGVILLIDGSSRSARADMTAYAEAFQRINAGQGFVVGVGRVSPDDLLLDECAQLLAERDIVAPVFGVDVRQRKDVLLLVETLLCLLEAGLPS